MNGGIMKTMSATVLRTSVARPHSIFACALFIMAAHDAPACTDQAIKRLGELGVGKSAVTQVWIYRESTQEGGLQGYKAWARLESCKGYAVIDMDTFCRPFQTYTTRDCAIPGVANY